MARFGVSSLRVKITLALVVTGLSGVLIVALLTRAFTMSEFDNYVVEQARADFLAEVTAYYEVYGTWDNIQLVHGKVPLAQQPPPPDAPADGAPASPVRFTLIDVNGEVILPQQDPPRTVPASKLSKADPVTVDGEVVGYIMPDDRFSGRDPREEAYLNRINQMLWIATAGAIVLALVLSFLFARSLTRPLREITAAIRSVARGHLETQVPVRSRDEVGEVAEAFNQMSADLARSNALRRQMTADIAHELRTPLSVVVGYLSSLHEGLLLPTPERFKIMHDEAQHLQRLVEDLRTLSLADAGELRLIRQQVAPAELLNLTAAAFSNQAEQRRVTLAVRAGLDLPLLHADPDRILQVLSNLVSNALRHTPEDGQITLSAQARENVLILAVQDTGSGIAPEHLPHVFERFYRADASRYQTNGESGLGMAIARSLVEVHGGSIAAASDGKSGTTITLSFPRAPDAAHPADPDVLPQ
ncbi:MAG TPA: ATP-binding protein [Aggregatilinea sp.]|uniref:sensor histidine kinase n=1 Tax=Aggregatilinea sp. TaxID=2806333 RepID=UPI002CF32647|nr:ATP-binding protein [Aggregatilinea sp.]HML22267.1 ATP-binding protein [Aggregatilinea sp.]